MANIFRRYSNSPVKIAFLGLEYAGKTSWITRISHPNYKVDDFQKLPSPKPTSGYDIVKIENEILSATIIDIGGQKNTRLLWSKFISDETILPEILVYVVDSSDPKRFDESYQCFQNLLSAIKTKRIVILAHKQDLDNAVPIEIIDKLFESKYQVIATSAITGEGITRFVQTLIDFITS